MSGLRGRINQTIVLRTGRTDETAAASNAPCMEHDDKHSEAKSGDPDKRG